MKQIVNVLNVKRYDFINSDGERVSGCSLLCAYSDDVKLTDNVKGLDIVKFNCDFFLFDEITQIPAKYNVDFDTDLTADGKIKLKPVALSLVK